MSINCSKRKKKKIPILKECVLQELSKINLIIYVVATGIPASRVLGGSKGPFVMFSVGSPSIPLRSVRGLYQSECTQVAFTSTLNGNDGHALLS